MFRHSSIRLKGLTRRILATDGTTESIARTVAAIAFAVVFVLGTFSIPILMASAASAAFAYVVTLFALAWIQARRQWGKPFRVHVGPLVIGETPAQESELNETERLRRYGIHSIPFIRARSVKLLSNGSEAYPEMLSAIENAQKTAYLETYILRADNTGKRFAAALIGAARRGVDTRLLFDGVGGMGVPDDYLRDLTEGGVAVRIFRPLRALWRRGFRPMNRRDHRKILTVDGKLAFTGGLNIADDYAACEAGGGGWRDTHIRIEGAEAAAALLKIFKESWVRADPRGKTLQTESVRHPSIENPEIESDKNVTLQILGNKEFLNRMRVRRAYVQAIKQAKRYILIENAYFIPDRGIRRALYKATKRGVHVAVAVAKYSDVKIAALASRSLYSELIAHGIRIFEYPISMLHCKAAVIDDSWAVVGSYNLDHRSLLHSLEVCVLALDRKVATELRERIMADIAVSHEVDARDVEMRTWSDGLFEGLAYQFRYWL